MAIYTHAVLGTNDLPSAIRFYDATLVALGLGRLGVFGDTGVTYGGATPEFILTKPTGGGPATAANGATLGFAAASRAAVHAFHQAALANGGTDEGPPGPRSFAPNAYGAYVRDPDGNKLATFCFAPE